MLGVALSRSITRITWPQRPLAQRNTNLFYWDNNVELVLYNCSHTHIIHPCVLWAQSRHKDVWNGFVTSSWHKLSLCPCLPDSGHFAQAYEKCRLSGSLSYDQRFGRLEISWITYEMRRKLWNVLSPTKFLTIYVRIACKFYN